MTHWRGERCDSRRHQQLRPSAAFGRSSTRAAPTKHAPMVANWNMKTVPRSQKPFEKHMLVRNVTDIGSVRVIAGILWHGSRNGRRMQLKE